MKGILRTALCVPHLHLGNPQANAQAHQAMAEKAAEKNASLLVFPELSLTGYTCGDLFFQSSLLLGAEKALGDLVKNCPSGLVCVAGIPVRMGSGLYNCAAVYTKDKIYGLAVKTFLPNNGEFYEKRWFRPASTLEDMEITLCGQRIIVSARPMVFVDDHGHSFGVEICEDLWAPVSPSLLLAMAGVEVVVNLSASNELIAKREYRRDLVAQTSARALCGYAYVSAGNGESTSDLVFSGHSLACVCGSVVGESEGYLSDDYLFTVDMDLDRIASDRMKSQSFSDCAALYAPEVDRIPLEMDLTLAPEIKTTMRVHKHPFIPHDSSMRRERCSQIFDLQSQALARRLQVTGGRLVIGISGGLDSTLALLVACHAMDLLGKPRSNIIGITMPCFGTTDRTYQNALELMRTLGTQLREIPIHDAVRLHFRDIGHDESDHSVTYENCQARERTQVLMDVANKENAIVLGTGDLSEIALGWCTYNADHMSMYGVNSGVPKTLVRWVVQTASELEDFAASRVCLQSVLDTPISPELLPPDEKGNILQQTEDLVGPYALHDFFLYYAVRFGYEPEKIFELCCDAFADDFDKATILKWLKNFYRRFFNQQFKRNCMPDGVKIGSIALSPRGDWRMPSDATSALWMRQCEEIQLEE